MIQKLRIGIVFRYVCGPDQVIAQLTVTSTPGVNSFEDEMSLPKLAIDMG